MLRAVLHNAIVAAAILLGSQAALAENRLALVIGQSAYRAVVPLPNPANDAKAMAQLLGDAGFDVVTAADLSQNDMRRTVGEFAAKIASKGPDTTALVFYAGHGMQVDGENFLIPIDIDPKRETDIPLQAVRLNDLLNTLTSVPSKMRIILLDACRNNPFPDINKTAGHGLAIVDAKVGAPAPSCPIRPRRARKPKTAAAPTVRIRRRCSPQRGNLVCRSRKHSSGCGFRSTRRPTDGRRRGKARR
jgi:uncharacterized caspase-like protein